MRLQRYFPSLAAEQVPWLGNFAAKLPAWQTVLGLSEAEVAAAVADARWAAYVLGSWQGAVRIFARTATESVEAALHGEGVPQLAAFAPPPLPDGVAPAANGALDRIFRLVGVLKLHRGCTAAVARDLGIGTRPETARAVPTFRLKAGRGADGQPETVIGFSVHGHEAVWIVSRRNNGEEEFLAIGVGTPWRDQRSLLTPGQAEVREYRMRFWDKGEPNGEWTAWRSIAVAP
ncbi:MAG: hypothetical protein WCF18_06510 [Chthoniobacteraceae bacterium]